MAGFFGCALIALGVLITFLSGACAVMLLTEHDKTLVGAAWLAIPFALVGIGLIVGGGKIGRQD